MSNIYKSVTIAELVEDFCPTNLSKEDYKLATLKEVDDDYRTKKLFFDPSYQRMYGSWDNVRKRKYIKSIFMKWIYTPIVFSELSKEAKKNQPKGVNYACLDGQHRTNAIAEFISNKFGLSGMIQIDGMEKNYNNVLFKDLTDRERAIFLRRTVEVQIIDPNKEDMKNSSQTLAQIFLAINDGAPLNSQEKRNAVQCDMSSWSRKCYENNKDFLVGKIYSDKHINRMAFHEYISKIYLFLKSFIISDATGQNRKYANLQDSNLDELYTSSYRIDSLLSTFISKDLLSIMNSAGAAIHSIHHAKRLQKKDLWLLTMLYSILVLEENKCLEDISENFTGKLLWEFTQETFSALTASSRKKQIDLFTKLENEEITMEQYKTNHFFHEEINRFHIAASAKICYIALYEHLSETVSGALKSWYTKKMTSVLKSA